MESSTDYRLTGEHSSNTFKFPITQENQDAADDLFLQLTKGEDIAPTTAMVQGREVHIPEAAQNTSVCRFTFADLCTRPLGAADYGAIARVYHTVFITGIPILDTGTRVNETRRFITLVDTLYEHHVKLICTADAAPHELLDTSVQFKQEVDIIGTAAAVQDNQDEAFAFQRTVSRLTEMQNDEYLKQEYQ